MKITPLVLVPVVSSLDSSYSAENLLEAVGHRNVTKMEALVQGLAEESLKEPHLKMDADIQEALRAIRTMFVSSIQQSLIEAHKADQESHNCGVEECFEKCEREKHGGVSTCHKYQDTCDKVKVRHVTCRTNVYNLYVDMATKCGKLHCFDVPDVKCKYESCLCPDLLYCARGHKKDCSSDTSPVVCEAVEGSCTSDPKDGFGAWLQQTITKYRAAWKEWNLLWTQCSAAYKEFLYADVECDGVQKEFESCMCEKSSMHGLVCGQDYHYCRAACWAQYEESVPPLQCQEKDRKIDWSATKKIECYLDILLHEYTKEELLKKCGTEDCINVAREKDYEHCSKICTEVDYCGEWGSCDVKAGNGWYGVVLDTHEFRKKHDQYHLGDNKFKCDTNGEGIFTEHRNREDRKSEHRCTEHLDIDFQVPPPPQPCEDPPEVCGPEFHCEYYAQFDDTSKIGIVDCCPEGGKGSCFPDKKMESCNGDGGAYEKGWVAELRFITFGEHTHAWAYNRCDCQPCPAPQPPYKPPPTPPTCSGIHTWAGECSEHSAYK